MQAVHWQLLWWCSLCTAFVQGISTVSTVFVFWLMLVMLWMLQDIGLYIGIFIVLVVPGLISTMTGCKLEYDESGNGGRRFTEAGITCMHRVWIVFCVIVALVWVIIRTIRYRRLYHAWQLSHFPPGCRCWIPISNREPQTDADGGTFTLIRQGDWFGFVDRGETDYPAKPSYLEFVKWESPTSAIVLRCDTNTREVAGSPFPPNTYFRMEYDYADQEFVSFEHEARTKGKEGWKLPVVLSEDRICRIFHQRLYRILPPNYTVTD